VPSKDKDVVLFNITGTKLWNEIKVGKGAKKRKKVYEG
jgi:hypothetical protein